MQKPSFEIPCVILCGGKSSRMGEDKSLLPFDDKSTLTQYQFDRLKPYFKDIYISSKIDKFDFLDKNRLLLDESEVYSPIAAIDSILNKLNEEKIFIITVDTPLVSIDSINKLISSSDDYDITVAKTIRTHNLCGVFSKSIKNTTEKMLNDDFHKVGFLLQNNKTNIIQLPNDDEFINLNHKEDYLKSLNLIS
ncbi:molybdenum cofactor guanylyltransferase MobA [Arcobacter roscoffensis]|uniref:Probable molybdenum cofactor guanylyltransferase n=1 Tax=Arcobacter roscoffensis TaxID=2961520 RepID=A0ABY5E6I6_9BACT|nr:molybdenum cofactor guanylyltransferase MobA [Arcobacter roscoffensis]UTJ06748.1 molybdenum cofactor guanylyltransferase MobA [Arcobacter roscoffensis]